VVRLAWFVIGITVVGAGSAVAAPSRVAVFRIEPLGIEEELVSRLDALFRLELERLEGAALPSRRAVDKAIAGDNALRNCGGETDCLAGIGKKLGVKLVVNGNVGALGDSYVINLKLIDAEAGKEVRRISEPLSGSPDELIDGMRVAAYRLVAPERLKGAIAILSDVNGAEVQLDGKVVGRTPLRGPLVDLAVGKHKLRISARGYTDFMQEVEVRFQKTTQVVVNLVAAKDPGGGPIVGGPRRKADVPWYATTWGYIGIGAGAVALGVIIGLAVANDEVLRCDEDPAACGL
jgi:hypothetical protein